jgi:hypothetical protein
MVLRKVNRSAETWLPIRQDNPAESPAAHGWLQAGCRQNTRPAVRPDPRWGIIETDGYRSLGTALEGGTGHSSAAAHAFIVI